MTGEERKAIAFVAVLLGLSVAARAVNRPQPVVVAGAAAVDIAARLDQNQQVRERSQKPPRKARSTSRPTASPPSQIPAWRRPGNGVVIDNRVPPGDVAAKTPVPINRATAAELDALPGVSPRVAGLIVEYRQAHGPITSLEQLDSIKGIGPALLEKLRPVVVFR